MTTRKRKTIRIPTPESLTNGALYYLARFAASEASLRRTLQNKLRRAAMAHPDFAADSAAQESLRGVIEKIILRHKETGVLNDAAFADMKVTSLRRAGRSARAIQQKLSIKGIAAATITQALQSVDEDDARGAELRAAQALAKRRRLGVYRAGETSPEQQRKDLATMARAGFALGIARQVLGGDFDDDAFIEE